MHTMVVFFCFFFGRGADTPMHTKNMLITGNISAAKGTGNRLKDI